jgi:hypothetical protein
MKFLCRRVSSESTAQRFAWAAGFAILVACTVIVMMGLREFSAAGSIALLSAVAVAWATVAAQLPKILRS